MKGETSPTEPFQPTFPESRTSILKTSAHREGKRIVSKTTRRDILKSGAAAGLAGMMNAVPGIAEAQSAQSAQTPELKWKAPGKQTGNNFNLIVLVSDTFRADNLAAYGSQW